MRLLANWQRTKCDHNPSAAFVIYRIMPFSQVKLSRASGVEPARPPSTRYGFYPPLSPRTVCLSPRRSGRKWEQPQPHPPVAGLTILGHNIGIKDRMITSCAIESEYSSRWQQGNVVLQHVANYDRVTKYFKT